MKPPPLCRYCGKAIAKKTQDVYVHHSSLRGSKYHRDESWCSHAYFDDMPRSKADIERQENRQVVSLRYDDSYHIRQDPELDITTRAPDPGRVVDRYSVWDGESYVDEYFCNGDHARRFGYVMARAGYQTAAYANATKEKAL